MQARLLLGPAGSGKTFRCLAEIRDVLRGAPEGPPLVLLAPKQATWQLERQLLADPSLKGYTRLHVLSFERLAYFIFARLSKPLPELLDEEGRVMVLRALLAKKRHALNLFRASARLTGFAQQLSLALREFQQAQLTPESLNQLALKLQHLPALAFKLQDLATLLQEYLHWLKEHNLQDVDSLPAAAAEAIAHLKSERQNLNSNRSASPSSTAQHLASARPLIPTGSERKSRSKRESLLGQLWMDGFSPQSPVQTLEPDRQPADSPPLSHPHALIEYLWADGFSELSEPELGLLVALLPYCRQATITFCLDHVPLEKVSWLSNWAFPRRSFEGLRKKLQQQTTVLPSTELLPRAPRLGRFLASSMLRYLEHYWADPQEFQNFLPPQHLEDDPSPDHSLVLPPQPNPPQNLPPPPVTSEANLPAPETSPQDLDQKAVRAILCRNPEAEATLAAREILRHVRAGGRYRDIAILVRKLEPYHDALKRIFSRYEIPFFIDRREPVSHHPLAELTRNALRTVTRGWLHDDWFAALKTGLLPAVDEEIDRLENEALARGWKGEIWQKPIVIPDDPELTAWLETLHARLLPPFHQLLLALAATRDTPTGSELASALRDFWRALRVEDKLHAWARLDTFTPPTPISPSLHATVLEELDAWVRSVELAFADESLPLRDWLPILEAGLANLSVGVVPPALDQVLIGAIDRARNSEVDLAIVLGLNESVFPALPESTALLTDMDRAELEKYDLLLSANARLQLGRERFLAYLAFTRARRRLILTSASFDANGALLNGSPFLLQIKRLFPRLQLETAAPPDWPQAQHSSELILPLLKGETEITSQGVKAQESDRLLKLPSVAAVLARLTHLPSMETDEWLSQGLAAKLYGPILRTSVSRLEQFAACPFKFFVHSGLRAEERKRFELDLKEQGSFQHDVLAAFHDCLQRENKRWRDITPQQARDLIARVATDLAATYRDGLLRASDQTRFLLRVMTESLQDFIETLVGWMRGQYRFDPLAVEIAFGDEDQTSAWQLDLGEGHSLALRGRIDRVDVCDIADERRVVVMDYKSSQRRLDPVLMANGLQLQLLAYLNVLRRWRDPLEKFGATRLIPAGVFYVSLRGKYEREVNRSAALNDTGQARQLAYRHTGRFDAGTLRWLDARPGVREGDQFNFRLTNTGRLHKNCREPLPTVQFEALLDSVEEDLKEMGQRIFAGIASVSPYRRGLAIACDQCDYRAICRIDPWTHRFRVLR